jgi:hypothetical protein
MARTRKAKTYKKQSKVLSIPELRKSLEHIDSYSEKLLATKPLKVAASLLASEWKRIFGKNLSLSEAESYLKNKSKHSKHKKTRKHRGGAMLTGAPLDHVTRPGDYIPAPTAVYPSVIAKGFWNPEPGILYDSSPQKTDPYSTTGSNKAMAGGGLLNSIGAPFVAGSFRPFVATNPITTGQGMMLDFKGLPVGPGANSYDNPNLKI